MVMGLGVTEIFLGSEDWYCCTFTKTLALPAKGNLVWLDTWITVSLTCQPHFPHEGEASGMDPERILIQVLPLSGEIKGSTASTGSVASRVVQVIHKVSPILTVSPPLGEVKVI